MREKRYGSEAEKMRAYRMRKKGFVLVEKEPIAQTDGPRIEMTVDEKLGADTELTESRPVQSEQESAGKGEVELSRPPPPPLTTTDRKFEDTNPGYFIYLKEVKKRKCRKCDKGFETRLELNQFCGPKCKTEFLKQFQTFGRANE